MDDLIEIRPRTRTQVQVTHQAGVLFDGKQYAKGDTLVMKHYEAVAHVKATMVEILGVIPGDPEPAGPRQLNVPAPPED